MKANTKQTPHRKPRNAPLAQLVMLGPPKYYFNILLKSSTLCGFIAQVQLDYGLGNFQYSIEILRLGSTREAQIIVRIAFQYSIEIFRAL